MRNIRAHSLPRGQHTRALVEPKAEWRRAPPWSQRGRRSRNTKERHGGKALGSTEASPRKPWDPRVLVTSRQHLHGPYLVCSGEEARPLGGSPPVLPLSGPVSLTQELGGPLLHSRASVSRTLFLNCPSNLPPLRFSTRSQKKYSCPPDPRWNGVPGAPKDAQAPYIKWPRRMTITVPLYPRVSYSLIQLNTEWYFWQAASADEKLMDTEG